MAALIVMPQRFLYSMAVAGASVGDPLGADRDPRRALAAGPARHAIDALSIRRGPAVSDTPTVVPARRGVMRRPVAVALASSALLLAAARRCSGRR
jgi:RND superfamily putative drug exporter